MVDPDALGYSELIKYLSKLSFGIPRKGCVKSDREFYSDAEVLTLPQLR